MCSEHQESNDRPVIGFNSEQLEDCDFDGTENIIQRIDLDCHDASHVVTLSSRNKLLFTDKQSFGQVVCIRHDHDGCVFILNDDNWDPKHSCTFPGFGYIEASKANKQFCISSPGLYCYIRKTNFFFFLIL